MLRLTTVPVDECRDIAAAHAEAPERRLGQRALARALTTLVHGEGAVAPVEEAAAVLFGDRPIGAVAEQTLTLLAAEIPSSSWPVAEVLGADPLDLLADGRVALAKSKGEARRNQAGYSLNQGRLADRTDERVGQDDLLHGRFLLLSRGRRTHHLVSTDGM